MAQNEFRPLGAPKAAQSALNRREFLGASVAVPAALALDATARAADGLEDPYDLRFIEDEQGMSVIFAQDTLEVDTNWCVITPREKVWRLHRLAFGPSTTFTLRTLQAGSKKGYELQIGGLRFGALEGRSHWIVFQRREVGHDWWVRMRSNLWSDVDGEMTSEDVLMSELVAVRASPREWSSDRRESEAPRWFVFNRTTIATNQILENLLEGHVRPSGTMKLELDVNCAWCFAPIGTSRLTVVPFGLPLHSLTLAWCEAVVTHEKGSQGLPDQFETLAALDEDTELSLIHQREQEEGTKKNRSHLPACCSDNTKPTKAKPKPLQTGTGAVSEPVFCGGGLTIPGETTFRYRGESSFAVTVQHSKKPQEKDAADLSFTFLRRDWNPPARGSNRPSGVAELKSSHGYWWFQCSLGRQKNLGRLIMEDGSVRVQRSQREETRGFEAEFSGVAGLPAPAPLVSPIGDLITHNWRSEDRREPRNRTALRAYYPPLSAASGQSGTLRWVSVPLLLRQCSLSLDNSDYSQFTFNAAAVTAIYYPQAKANSALGHAQSYIWLGGSQALNGHPVASLDLTRARLTASRCRDLLDVAFLFANLKLEVQPGKLRIVPTASTYGVIERRVAPRQTSSPNSFGDQSNVVDSRPTLVIEFPPQHVFEETMFKPGGGDFPDVALPEDDIHLGISQGTFQVTMPDNTTRTFSIYPPSLLQSLETCNLQDRIVVRSAYAALKYRKDEGPFKALYNKLKDNLKDKPKGTHTGVEDQYIYIGPYGMDPDVRAKVRKVISQMQHDALSIFVSSMLNSADDIAQMANNRDMPKDRQPKGIAWLVQKVKLRWRSLMGTTPDAPKSATEAVLKETALASVLGDYAFFRDYYRERMIQDWMIAPKDEEDAALRPDSAAPEQIEFFTASNRGWASSGLQTKMQQRQKRVLLRYPDVLSGKEEPVTVMRGRLANPSRLAFRLNLLPSETLSFSLESLLDWQRHELAVSPRARAMTVFDQAGRDNSQAEQAPPTQAQDALDTEIPELAPKPKKDPENNQAGQQGVAEDASILRLLGFRSGQFVTAQERLSDVEASLRRPPDPLETAIEIPARLILSPSQRAQWKVPWVPLVQGPFAPPTTGDSSQQLQGPLPLWSVELMTQHADPALRAVYSPDLRPGFVRRGVERSAAAAANAQRAKDGNPPLFTVAAAAPPRGPRAPWTLGVEDGDSASTQLDLLAPVLGVVNDQQLEELKKPICPPRSKNSDMGAKGGQEGCEAACLAAESLSAGSAAIHPLIAYLRWRRAAHDGYGKSALFRSCLDAYDRHEIVILSSAYGLPVRGKRDERGKLLPLAASSQVEPPLLYQPIDLELGSALYRPRSLKLQEMRLSALGGTFRHDTDFIPPTAARHILYGPLHDSLSVERWQHWVVLGRDVFAEVVYKGFLFPIGHRASLVKQTERVFLKATSGGSVRAYLRQRLFIRVGQPDKTFPALGQPNLGRQFPAKLVHLLTTVTPDLVDPSQDTDQNGSVSAIGDAYPCGQPAPSPAGRLLSAMPGLVFWPRTARVPGAEVRFDALLGGSFVKLPLIFADNTATQDPEVLAALVLYYNHLCSPDENSGQLDTVLPAKHLRTIDFAGQALQYSEEVKPGSSSHRTLFWTLKASGGVRDRAKPDLTSPTIWNGEGDNTAYDNPVLDGADQPAFYPALETARIRLDQIERMTAQESVVALARFDGHYLAYGFPASSESPDTTGKQAAAGAGTHPETPNAFAGARANQLEMYLRIMNSVSFSMGAAGDRSGGVYRPEGEVVALSRRRGPIGGSDEVRQMPTVVNAYAGSVNDTYANYFNSASALDTKLLGIVSLKDLVQKFQTLRPASEGLPQLRELLNYGAAGASSTEQSLRSEIILPLNQALAELQRRWDRLNQQLQDQSKTLGNLVTLHIEDVFPELNQAKNDFNTALGHLNAQQGVEFFGSLSDVYETGRRLADALARAPVNTIERSYLAFLNTLPDLLKNKNFDLSQMAKNVTAEILKMAPASDQRLFRQTVASCVLSDPRSVARFLPVTGGMDSEHFNALQQKVAALSEEFRTITEKGVDASVQDFVDQLPPVPASVSKVWKDSLHPLFEMVSNFHRAIVSGDLQAWAAAAMMMMKEFGPVPKGWTLEDSSLQKLLTKLSKDLNTLEETMANLSVPTLAQDFLPNPGSIDLPPAWKQPPTKAGYTLERTLYDFAIVAKQASQGLGTGDGRSFLIGAGNVALVVAQQLHRLCEKLEEQTSLPALDLQLKNPDALLRIGPDLIQRIFNDFAELMKAVEAALDALLPKAFPALAELDPKLRKQFSTALRNAVSRTIQTQQRACSLATDWVSRWTALKSLDDKAAANELDQVIRASQQSLKAASSAVTDIGDEWQKWRTSNRNTLRPLAPDFLPSLAQKTADHLLAWWSGALANGTAAQKQASTIAARIVPILEGQYKNLLEAREKVASATHGIHPVLERSLYVTPEAPLVYKGAGFDKSNNDQQDQLYWDHKSLQTLSSKDPDTFLEDPDRYRFVMNFLNSWADGSATPMRIIQQLQGPLSIEGARAMLLSMVDFSSVREEVDKAIRNLIPHSSELTYSFDFPLEQEAAKKATAGIFAPQEGCKLVVTSKTKVDFLNKTTQFRSEGELGPFHIKLLGDGIADALTLKFNGVRFESTGGPVHCDVDFQDFELGPTLKFLEQLQKFLTPKKGSGFYLVPLSTGLGIEAGYGLKLGTISFGNVSFSNISLNAAARLPFDGHEATFVSSLSRRDAPFTISVAPYGGSGFFLIEASAKGVTAFEASFEYGGAAAFSYGPLNGVGRVMIGVYIRVGDRGSIAATFYAGGSASIWIFTFGASLYITAASEKGSSTIVGTATFTFSFSIGFADYDFHVSVRQTLTWGGGGSGSSNGNRASLNSRPGPPAPVQAANPQQALYRADSWCQSEHWGRHRDHFDTTLPIDTLEFA